MNNCYKHYVIDKLKINIPSNYLWKETIFKLDIDRSDLLATNEDAEGQIWRDNYYN